MISAFFLVINSDMAIKLVVGVEILNVVYVYAPQLGLTDETKREFWDELEGVI